jgi:hypothetical protein
VALLKQIRYKPENLFDQSAKGAVIISTRLKRRAAPFLLVMVMAWMLAFATHLHTAKEDFGAREHPARCLFCAAFPAGAPPSEPVSIPAASVRHDSSVRLPSLQAEVSHFYRSRAPPSLQAS